MSKSKSTNVAQATTSFTHPKDARRGNQINVHMVANVLLVWLDANIDESNSNYQNTVSHLRREVHAINIFADAMKNASVFSDLHDHFWLPRSTDCTSCAQYVARRLHLYLLGQLKVSRRMDERLLEDQGCLYWDRIDLWKSEASYSFRLSKRRLSLLGLTIVLPNWLEKMVQGKEEGKGISPEAADPLGVGIGICLPWIEIW